ncbi:unnamed protein product [Amoebophrya sp. A120]|nr:unnamed protein product [Amoebophrya sp. A120]|eukprot:GSA120T00015963001.1
MILQHFCDAHLRGGPRLDGICASEFSYDAAGADECPPDAYSTSIDPDSRWLVLWINGAAIVLFNRKWIKEILRGNFRVHSQPRVIGLRLPYIAICSAYAPADGSKKGGGVSLAFDEFQAHLSTVLEKVRSLTSCSCSSGTRRSRCSSCRCTQDQVVLVVVLPFLYSRSSPPLKPPQVLASLLGGV